MEEVKEAAQMRNEEKAHRMHTTIETDTDKEALCDSGER